MLVTFFCEYCDAKLRITADAMGSSLTCPECDRELEVPHMSLGPGFVVGGFLIKHKIGEGGMGEVYLATQLSLERDVALKILPGRFTRERSFVVRFLKEVHYQAKLDHPNVVAAFDAGEDSGVYYMAMAYVEGETLEERLDREGPLQEKDSLQIMRQVGLALEYAREEKGLLHRDIKPGNIMVTPTTHAKVLDMGLSKNILEKKSTTMADTLLGTPNYMSPEQIDHPQDLDTRSDMFSVGMTLYHMLTGQVPYEETSYLQTLKRHANEQVEDPRSLIPGIGRHTVHFLARLLARDPEDRYQTWELFQQDLRDVMAQKKLPDLPAGPSCLDVREDLHPEPVLPAEEPSGTAPTSTRTVRGVLVSIAAGVALGASVVGLLVSMVPRSEGTSSAPPAPDVAAVTADPLPEAPAATPVPMPAATPTPDSARFSSELARLILEVEQNPEKVDEILAELADLGIRAADTPIAEEAALQLVRIRRDRDRALEKTRSRIRSETLRLLYEQGGDAARGYLEGLDTHFAEDLQPLVANLRRRIRIWKQQKQEQREAEQAAASERLKSRTRGLVPLVLNRDWQGALDQIDKAARDPMLFPVAENVAALRREIVDLREVRDAMVTGYERRINQPVVLGLMDREVEVILRGVEPGGLRVERTVTDEQGQTLGRVEQIIPFSQLSSDEVLSRLDELEGEAVDITRGLIAYRDGDLERTRTALRRAGTPLADAIRNELFALPTLETYQPLIPQPDSIP